MKISRSIKMSAEEVENFLQKSLSRYIEKKVDGKVNAVEVTHSELTVTIQLEEEDLEESETNE